MRVCVCADSRTCRSFDIVINNKCRFVGLKLLSNYIITNVSGEMIHVWRQRERETDIETQSQSLSDLD